MDDLNKSYSLERVFPGRCITSLHLLSDPRLTMKPVHPSQRVAYVQKHFLCACTPAPFTICRPRCMVKGILDCHIFS